MSKFTEIISLLMSGDMDSAASAFVENMFDQVNIGIPSSTVHPIDEPVEAKDN